MKLQNLGNSTVRFTLCATALVGASLSSIQAAEDEGKRNPAISNQNVTSSASISSKVNNGTGVVTYNGEEVWSGEIKNGLRTAAQSTGGEDPSGGGLAAVWDGEEVVWESEAGAGKKLKGMVGKGMGGMRTADLRKKLAEMMNRADFKGNEGKNASSISGSVSNGEGVVTYQGKEVWTGKVENGLSVKSEASGDKEKYDGEYAAAWDGEKVVWENVKGAAEALGKGK